MNVELGGAWLRVVSDGLGPPLVLLHGGPGIGDNTASLGHLLAEHFRVIRFDQRGCGASSKTPPFDVPTLLTDIEALRLRFGAERWAVAGHSWGADVALAYALTYPERTTALLHLCGTGIQNDRDWKAAYEAGRRADPAPQPSEPEDLGVKRSYLASWRAWIKAPDLLRRLAHSPTPALFLVGDQDTRPDWPNAQLANLMPNGRLVILPGAGHEPWSDRPGELKRLILDFMSSELGILRSEEQWPQFGEK